MAKREVCIDESLAQDPNFIAYREAAETGQFKDLEPGTYVAYAKGKLVGMGMDREEALQGIEASDRKEAVFLKQVNVERRVVFRRPKRVRCP